MMRYTLVVLMIFLIIGNTFGQADLKIIEKYIEDAREAWDVPGLSVAIVKDGELAIATVMTCTLSVDHRSVDGAVGAEFLQAFKKYIEQPLNLMLRGG